MSAIPNMRVYLPSDRHQTRELAKALLWDEKPAYIRVGRNPVEDIYTEDSVPFVMDQATVLQEGAEVLLVACGEMVRSAKSAGEQLAQIGHPTTVLDMYCVKPLDKASIVRYAQGAKLVVTVEEHTSLRWFGLHGSAGGWRGVPKARDQSGVAGYACHHRYLTGCVRLLWSEH